MDLTQVSTIGLGGAIGVALICFTLRAHLALVKRVQHVEDARVEDLKTIVRNNTEALQRITIALDNHTVQLAKLVKGDK
jgi:hypothetical protein